PTVMRRTVRLAKQHGVAVGAHPSLPDLQGFGRREMTIPRDELADIITYQVGALKGFLDAVGMALNHIKPHGVLYGMAARDEEAANAVCDAAGSFDVPLFGMRGTLHEKIYPTRGSSLIAEFYADLDYAGDGRLIITREHAAVDPDDAASKCVRAIEEGLVRSVDGNDVPVGADTICIHSDTPNAVAIAEAVMKAVRPYRK
ncbi:MAG: LamB/YcsF family protein, partial [Geminicoccaceae bacterium]